MLSVGFDKKNYQNRICFMLRWEFGLLTMYVCYACCYNFSWMFYCHMVGIQSRIVRWVLSWFHYFLIEQQKTALRFLLFVLVWMKIKLWQPSRMHVHEFNISIPLHILVYIYICALGFSQSLCWLVTFAPSVPVSFAVLGNEIGANDINVTRQWYY